MLIDTHCHLQDPKLEDISGVIERAREAGVEKIICPMGNLWSWEEVRELIENNRNVYALVGIHPEDIEETGPLGVAMKRMEEILKHPKVKGVGEIGLDFYYDKEKKSKKKQIEFFRAQLEMAVAYGKPVAIHMREAEEEMKEVLTDLKKMPNGQFHCFAGSEEFLKMVLDNGFYVSFCGNVTYRNADNLRSLVTKVPLSRLLLETDTPYLSPEPLRGRINEPANVKIIAEFIAKLRGESFETVAAQTSRNAICLLSLDTL